MSVCTVVKTIKDIDPDKSLASESAERTGDAEEKRGSGSKSRASNTPFSRPLSLKDLKAAASRMNEYMGHFGPVVGRAWRYFSEAAFNYRDPTRMNAKLPADFAEAFPCEDGRPAVWTISAPRQLKAASDEEKRLELTVVFFEPTQNEDMVLNVEFHNASTTWEAAVPIINQKARKVGSVDVQSIQRDGEFVTVELAIGIPARLDDGFRIEVQPRLPNMKIDGGGYRLVYLRDYKNSSSSTWVWYQGTSLRISQASRP